MNAYQAPWLNKAQWLTDYSLISLSSGIESFEGRYFHSWHYRNSEGLQGKRVVVVGIGNSGGDIAVEISRVAEKVHD